MPEEMQIYYHGRKWDAPFTDGAIEAPLLLEGVTCDYCKEIMLDTDDLLIMPYTVCHLECNIRAGMGDVAHLEGRCICSGSSPNLLPREEDMTYREEAKATVQWLIDNHRGRFHP